MKITWGDLEVGHRIADSNGDAAWTVVDLTSSHITVAVGVVDIYSWGSDAPLRSDVETSTFTRKDPWEPVEIIPLEINEIEQLVGGQVISEEVDGVTSYFAWPEDPDFRSAAASHLQMVHGIAVGSETYAELLALHNELHRLGMPPASDHTHIERKDTHEG